MPRFRPRGGSRVYGSIRSAFEAKGAPIGPYDMVIAAHVLSQGLILVTDNEREFRRISGLETENWRL